MNAQGPINQGGIDTRRALATAVHNESARGGYRVESQTETDATLVKGKNTSHGLHLFLSIITGGLWLLVWPVIWFLNREKRVFLSVDEYGAINRSEA